MKAFVAVAFLVASVAAQNLDFLQLNKEKSLFKGENRLVEDLLLKEKLGQHFGLTTEQEFPTWGRQQVNLLSLEEIIATPLFREYYNIPLFRQFWEEYPVVFRRYIQSVLFQQFWTVPAFQQYFRNPAYFYKYIVPQVQVVAQTIRQGGDIYGIVNKYNKPQFNQQYESIVEQLINQKYYNKYGMNKEFTVPMTQGLEYPTTMYGNKDVINYKFLLDKIYNELKYGKINGEITETMTDVRALPTGQIVEKTLGKIVDPITGMEKVTVGDIKLVDEKIVPVQTLDFPVEKKYNTIVESELVKDALLKKMYLNKIFGKKMINNFYPETYETILNKGLYNYEPTMMNKYESIMYPTMNKEFTPYNKEFNTFNKEFTPYNKEFTTYNKEFNTFNKFNQNKYISPIVARMYGLNKFNKMNTLPMFTQQYNKMDLFNQFQTEKMIEEIQKEKMIKNQMPFLNKEQELFNIFNTEKTMNMEIPKMMETEKFQTIPLTFGKPIIGSGLNEFQKEIKEYQLQKELNEIKY
jgi:hypothetical protein